MDGHERIHIKSAEHLFDLLEKMIGLLVETGEAYAVVSLGDTEFVQIMASDDGRLRLESSASDKVLASNLGFDERLEHFDHIAATLIPADVPAKERWAARTMTRLVVEVHEIEFPTDLDFNLDVNEYAMSS